MQFFLQVTWLWACKWTWSATRQPAKQQCPAQPNLYAQAKPTQPSFLEWNPLDDPPADDATRSAWPPDESPINLPYLPPSKVFKFDFSSHGNRHDTPDASPQYPHELPNEPLTPHASVASLWLNRPTAARVHAARLNMSNEERSPSQPPRSMTIMAEWVHMATWIHMAWNDLLAVRPSCLKGIWYCINLPSKLQRQYIRKALEAILPSI